MSYGSTLIIQGLSEAIIISGTPRIIKYMWCMTDVNKSHIAIQEHNACIKWQTINGIIKHGHDWHAIPHVYIITSIHYMYTCTYTITL